MTRPAIGGVLAAIVLAAYAAATYAADDVRVLFDFEQDGEIEAIAQDSQAVVFDLSQDAGVTSGKRCCRMVFRKGGGYAEVHFTGDRRQGWADYDYFAMDVNVAGEDRTALTLEFWDALTRGYPTRCSLVADVVPGQQTVLIPITRPKRNNKEGREWSELEPQDKMDLRNLRVCKLFLQTPMDHDLVWRVDNIRLLKESALGRKMEIELPPGTVAFNFGAAPETPSFTAVPASASFDGVRGFTRQGALADCGKRWPDPLAGTGVYAPDGRPFAFESKLPDGDYLVWLIAAPVMRHDMAPPRYLLRVGDRTLCEDAPTASEYEGEKHLYRFMRTVYSQRPEALWEDFIARMYPVYRARTTVGGGKLRVEAGGFQLCALAVLPAAREGEFERMTNALDGERRRVFRAALPALSTKGLRREPGDSACVAFVPADGLDVTPQTAPPRAANRIVAYDLAATPSQNLVFRLGVTAFAEAGSAAVRVSPLRGPGEIPSSAARVYFQNFRRRGVDVVECGLLPTNAVPLEPGMTRCFWMWMRVPRDARAGDYTGAVTLSTGVGETVLPVRLKVYGFRLAEALPYSFGMWYRMPDVPDEAVRRRVVRGQLDFMREIGFTGIEAPGPGMDGLLNAFLPDLAREAGMGCIPAQMSQISALGMARQIGRVKLGLGARIDQRPGCEFDSPEFRGLFLESARSLASSLRACPLPLAVQTVDEPREMPNPWNRTGEQANLYADWLREAGVRNTFVTPMADGSSGKDYTPLADHHDIIATHAGKASEKLMTLTPRNGKTLWLYNCGMDRFSWGFYNWRVGSKGRWEWHFRWTEGGGLNGYPNDEWYNPFTSLDAAAPPAPFPAYSGGMLFKSGFLTCADGITDTAYLVTLEEKLASGRGDPAVRAQAAALLDGLKKEIAFLPDVRGLANAESAGALVGEGIQAPAAAQCETWRRRIAGFLERLPQ